MPLTTEKSAWLKLRLLWVAAVTLLFGGLAIAWIVGWMGDAQDHRGGVHAALKILAAAMSAGAVVVELGVRDHRWLRAVVLMGAILVSAAAWVWGVKRYPPIYDVFEWDAAARDGG